MLKRLAGMAAALGVVALVIVDSWAAYGLVTGWESVVVVVRREENPVLFWTVRAAWLVLAVLTLIHYLAVVVRMW